MRIMVINPNCSAAMTTTIRKALMAVKSSQTSLEVVHLEGVPLVLQSTSDDARAIPVMLDLVQRINMEGYDAIVIASFSDPGLEAAREISDILVLGIEETSFHIAAMLGHRFGIITPLARSIPQKYREARRFGLEGALASVRSLDLATIDPAGNAEYVKASIRENARQMMSEDGVEVIVLGCAGMAGYAPDIESGLGIVVIDPVTVTLKICESLLNIPLRHSKKGFYATPVAVRQTKEVIYRKVS